MINRSITANDTRYRFTPDVGSPVEYEVEFLGTVANGGTDVNDVTLLNDTVAGRYGLDAVKAISDPTNPLFASPNNAFKIIKDMLDDMLNRVYPIGTIYQTDTISTAGAMNTQFGGTWVAWGAGRVPVGINTGDPDFDTVNKTGGHKSLQAHTHTTPNHTHTTENTTAVNGATTSTMASGGGGTSGSTTPASTGAQSTGHLHAFSGSGTANTGGSHTHDLRYLTYTTPSGSTHAIKGGSNSSSTHDDFIYGTSGSHSHTVNVSGTTGDIDRGHTHTSSAHTHTTPAHTHTMDSHNHTQTAHNHTISSSGAGTSGSTGAGSSENLQPYQVCYFWKRTA